jgi:flagellar motor switch protein FliG
VNNHSNWKEKGAEYLFHLLNGSVPEEVLDELIHQVKSGDLTAENFLKEIHDIHLLANKLQKENNDLIVAFLLHMNSNQAATILETLPDDKRFEVSKKLAFDETRCFISILSNLTINLRNDIFSYLKTNDSNTYEKVKRNYFMFEDLLKLDERSLRVVLNNITDNSLIACSLKNMSENFKKQILNAVSSGRKTMLTDEIESIGTVKLGDIIESQEKIMSIVKQLERDGNVVIQRF